MGQTLNVVAVSGSVFTPSRTLILIQELMRALQGRLRMHGHVIELQNIAMHTGTAFTRQALPDHIDAQLQAIEAADLLIVGTPVYRGSLPGQLKHVFDLIEQDALVDKPVLMLATGGSERHALIIDHQIRPLFSFFQALTLPIGIYASNADFEHYKIQSTALLDRIALAVDRAVLHFPSHINDAAAIPVAHEDRVTKAHWYLTKTLDSVPGQ